MRQKAKLIERRLGETPKPTRETLHTLQELFSAKSHRA